MKFEGSEIFKYLRILEIRKKSILLKEILNEVFWRNNNTENEYYIFLKNKIKKVNKIEISRRVF